MRNFFNGVWEILIRPGLWWIIVVIPTLLQALQAYREELPAEERDKYMVLNILSQIPPEILNVALWLVPLAIIGYGTYRYIQKRRVEKSSQTHSEDGIEDAITLTPKPRENNKYVSIIVKNNLPNKTIFCTPFLERAEWQYNPTTRIPIVIDAKELSWHQGSDEPEVEIQPGREKIINVAKTNGNDLVFTLFSGNVQQSSIGKHYIWVDVLWRASKESTKFFEKELVGCIGDVTSDPKNKVGRYETPNGSWRSQVVSGISIWECDNEA